MRWAQAKEVPIGCTFLCPGWPPTKAGSGWSGQFLPAGPSSGRHASSPEPRFRCRGYATLCGSPRLTRSHPGRQVSRQAPTCYR